MDAPLAICVLVRATEATRIAEALRAAVGVGLRGAIVTLALDRDARAQGDAHELERARWAIEAMGGRVVDLESLIALPARVEVWT